MSEGDGVTFEVTTVVVCDEQRREDNGKMILIGVYNEKVFVPQFPAPLALSFWLQGIPSGPGQGMLYVRVSAGEAEFLNNSGPIAFNDKELSSISVPPVPCIFQQPSELKLELKSRQDEPWRTIKTIKIAKRDPATQRAAA